MINFTYVFIALATSLVTTRYALRLSQQLGIFDIPNARSSHVQKTPRGGGIGIVVPTLVLTAVYCSLQYHWLLGAPLIIGGATTAIMGWLDDRYQVSVRTRLIVQIIISVSVATYLVSLGSPAALSHHWVLGTGVGTIVVLALVLNWNINLYNFMDGINGIAAIQSITVAGIFAILDSLFSGTSLSTIFLLLAGSTAGFLVFNYSPAKIFMGDVGSNFLGFVFGSLTILEATVGNIPLITSAIIMGVFLTDSTATLLVRLFQGQDVTSPHRNHAYQHAVQSGFTHSTVTIFVGTLNCLWLAPLAYLSLFNPKWDWAFLAIAYIPLLALCIHFRAGAPYDSASQTKNPA